MNNCLKKSEGITLIALVITVVVILIIAGISINLVLGENGIIFRSKDAKERTIIAEEKEKVEFIASEIQLRKLLNESAVDTQEELQEIVDMYFGKDDSNQSKAVGVISGEKYEITVIATGHKYVINGDGTVEEEESYSIIYNLNGGSFAQGTTIIYSYNTGDIVTFPTPEKSGYGFGGWYLNPGFTGDTIISTESDSNSNITLYAKWLNETDADYFDYALVNEENQTITISGKRQAWTTAYNNNADDALNLVIPAVYHGEVYPQYDGYKIVQINDSMFNGLNKIKSVVFSNNMQIIGQYTFIGTSIESLIIPENVTAVRREAFRDCTSLKKIVLRSADDSITWTPFGGLTNLEELELPISMNVQQQFGENGCQKLRKVIFTPGTGLGYDYTGYPLPWNCSQTEEIEIILQEGITKIGNQTFKNRANLKNIKIPSTVTTIGAYAFLGTGIENLYIPANVTQINAEAFKDCTSMKKLIIKSSNLTLNWGPFGGLTNLEEIEVPVNVNVQQQFNNGCSKLKKVLITQGTGTGFDYGDYDKPWTLSQENNMEVILAEGITRIGNYMFMRTSAVKSITIPSTVTSIGNHAFRNMSGLEQITIPSLVTSIGGESFAYSANLKKIIIKSSSFTMGWGAFRDLTSLEEIELPISLGLETDFGSGCRNIKKVTFTEGTGIGFDYGEGNKAWTLSEVENINFTLQGNITRIGKNTFRGTAGLKNITLPNTITTIKENAFLNCVNLESVNMPTSLQTIEAYAFQSCSSLDGVAFGSNLTTIGAAAFRYCNSLTNITIPTTVTTVGENSFNSCTGLKNLYILGEPTIGFAAFGGETSLENLKMPVSIYAIGTIISTGESNSLKTITFTPAINLPIPNYSTNIAIAGTTYGWQTTPWYAARHNGLKIYAEDGVEFGSDTYFFFRLGANSSTQANGGDGCNAEFYAYSSSVGYSQTYSNYVDVIVFTPI